MSVERYKLELSYLGQDFNGWQSQADGSGVQDFLEKSLKTLLGKHCRVTGASRTDSGVHARHQVAVFEAEHGLDQHRLLAGLAALLPASIGISSVEPCAREFHPILNAKAKAYCYRFWRGRSRDPFMEPFVHRVPQSIAVESMREAALYFVGRHDFTAFCALDSGAKTRTRTVLASAVVEQGPIVELWVLGEGFLKQMVRIIAGTLLEVGYKKRLPGSIRDLINGGSRGEAGPTLPGKGLTLERIFFEQPPVAGGPPAWTLENP